MVSEIRPLRLQNVLLEADLKTCVQLTHAEIRRTICMGYWEVQCVWVTTLCSLVLCK